MIFPQIS